jgi:WhiB family redox-sensing transcriptional regulator
MGHTHTSERWSGAICSDLEPDIFFPNAGRPPKNPEYKTICGNCPIQHSCLEYGIVHEEEGVWGGQTKSERDSLPYILKQTLIQKAKKEGWFEYRKSIDELVETLVPVVSLVPDRIYPEEAYQTDSAPEEFLFDFERVEPASSEFVFDFESAS